ncbi:peptide-methionine (R)-S-oxide reductase [Candidatus Saccharibacteria bacterium]|nr:MAG: peptide-methionine (R)-S-oxide reductase [Candidatus Saccharibacteria bacterium]
MSKIQKSEDEWKKQLTPEQYRVLRQKGTEVPGTGELLYNEQEGTYLCAACGNPLFGSDTKYESTMPGLIGWPSFSDAVNNDALELIDDTSLGMHRLEAVCSNCGSHLGHYFDDPTSPNGKHFCINSLSLKFKKED